MESPTCIAEESTATRECSNSITESHGSVGRETNEATASGTGGEQQRSDKSLSASSEPARNVSLVHSLSPTCQDSARQSPCSRCEVAAEFRSVLKRPSVVITNLRSQARGLADSVSSPRMTSSNKKRDRCQVAYDDNVSDHCDDPDDADYVDESKCSSRRSKRARQTAVRLGPRRTQRTRHDVQRLSVDEAVQTKVAGDQNSLSSLPDIETIPIRGFLMRQILFSKVIYSITFEEQALHGSSDRAPPRYENEDARPHEQRPHEKAPRSMDSTRPTQFLPEDDRLLIELKEQRGLPWKRIAECFPERSKGSLQVRYCRA